MIRLASNQDSGAIISLLADLRPLWTAEMVNSVMANVNADVGVIDVQGIKAVCIVEYVMGEGNISAIVTEPASRKRGYAKSLLSFCESLRNKTNIYLEVNEHNLSALSLYKSCGYAEVGLRKNYYGTDSAIIMNKLF